MSEAADSVRSDRAVTSVLTIYGTRPEAIKMAPVVRELDRRGVDQTICVTAQHRGLLDQVNSLFEIVPTIDLDLMEPGQSPTAVAARVLSGLEAVLAEQRPDWVLVQGDTTTVLAAAMAAAYAGVPVAHLEAGLRSGDRTRPFPEEINRVATTALSSLHLAPTQSACDALLGEGVRPESVVLTGNTVIDALHWVSASNHAVPPASPIRRIDADRRLVLLTAHRRESFGDPLAQALQAVADLARERLDSIQVLFPVHPNPNVTGAAADILGDLENVILCKPLSYLELVRALQNCWFVITDSGGIQEEAPALGKPVLVLRDVTERPEAVKAGGAQLVGTSADLIGKESRRLLDDPERYASMSLERSPYGDGKAAARVVSAMLGEAVEPFDPDA